ncbi:MAG: PAS domain-containing protein [Ilumatobacter sp.]
MSAITPSAFFDAGGGVLAEQTLRSVGAGLAVFDAAARLLQADQRAGELLELQGPSHAPATLDHPRWSAIRLDGAALDAHTDPVRRALHGAPGSFADVVGILQADGETRWLAVTALKVPAIDDNGDAALASFIDVTGIVRDRAAVDSAERLGRATFDEVSIPMCVCDAVGSIVEWNRAFATRLGRPDFEIMRTAVDRWLPGAWTLSERAEPLAAVEVAWANGHPTMLRRWPHDGPHGGCWMVELA